MGDFDGTTGPAPTWPSLDASDNPWNITILSGNGAGYFPVSTPVLVELDGQATIVAGDFNGDGRTDLAAVSYSDQSVTCLINQGPSVPFKTLSYSKGFLSLCGIAAGDFNGEGHDGLAVLDQGFAPGAGSVTILQVVDDSVVVRRDIDQHVRGHCMSAFQIAAVALRGDTSHMDLAVGEQGPLELHRGGRRGSC